MAGRGSPTISIWRVALRSRRSVLPAFAAAAFLGLWQSGLASQVVGSQTVTGTVSVSGAPARTDLRDVVVWLSPIGARDERRPNATGRFKIEQRDKTFRPHVLAVPVGSFVEFPNLDPIFHNVFSLFDGKRFDLGLYEAGTTRGVNFTRAGICYVFCNIHPDMSAVVVVVDSPFYTTSTGNGALTIPDVPSGRYRMSVWHERFTPEDPREFPKELTIGAGAANIGAIRLRFVKPLPDSHKNKFGHEYAPPGSNGPIYP